MHSVSTISYMISPSQYCVQSSMVFFSHGSRKSSSADNLSSGIQRSIFLMNSRNLILLFPLRFSSDSSNVMAGISTGRFQVPIKQVRPPKHKQRLSRNYGMFVNTYRPPRNNLRQSHYERAALWGVSQEGRPSRQDGGHPTSHHPHS